MSSIQLKNRKKKKRNSNKRTKKAAPSEWEGAAHIFEIKS